MTLRIFLVVCLLVLLHGLLYSPTVKGDHQPQPWPQYSLGMFNGTERQVAILPCPKRQTTISWILDKIEDEKIVLNHMFGTAVHNKRDATSRWQLSLIAMHTLGFGEPWRIYVQNCWLPLQGQIL